MGTRYLKIVLETSPDRRRLGAWERLGKTKLKVFFKIIIHTRSIVRINDKFSTTCASDTNS
jgi:hypothetical protein